MSENDPPRAATAATHSPHHHHHSQQDHQHSPIRRYLTRNSTQARFVQVPVQSSAYLCGLAAGVVQAAIFHPYDRALYLSIREKQRHFLAWQNWQSPYNGFFQSIGGRALSGGLYFPLEHYFLHILSAASSSSSFNDSGGSHPQQQQHNKKHNHNIHHSFWAGTAAGAVNAVVLNPLSALKYKTWGRPDGVSRGMWAEAAGMIHKSGGTLRPFWNGVLPTIYRDVVFGGCYTYLRLVLSASSSSTQQDGNLQQWQANCLAAALATIASGPFNYVRNIQYSTKSRDRALSTGMILLELWMETVQHKSIGRQVHFLLNRLRIGWGTARVAMGISLGHSVYDILVDNFR